MDPAAPPGTREPPMSITVRLRVFSALEDPHWTLTDQEEKHLREWIAHVNAQSAEGAGAPPVLEDDLPTSGYRGFDINVDGQLPVRVFRNSLVTTRATADSIDRFLFETNRQRLQDEFGLDETVLVDRAPERIRNLPPNCPSAELNCGPLHFAGTRAPWNEGANRLSNTCYNYANNVMTPLTVFPGNSTSQALDVDDLRRLLHRDALEFAGMDFPTACPAHPHDHYVAAVLNTTRTRGDYHFFRLDRNGCWSQKQSTDRINNHDDSRPRRPLSNLCAAEFNAPMLFAGFFISTVRTRHILAARGGV